VIVLGIANLVADGFSMGISNFWAPGPSSSSGADLERVVEVITSDPQRWVDTMVREELDHPSQEVSSWRAGLITYWGFTVAGLVPLLPFIYQIISPSGLPDSFLWSAVLAGIVFFVIGAIKSRYVDQSWFWSGLETFAVGGVAAAAGLPGGGAAPGFNRRRLTAAPPGF
jgi:VIT1/CCC1 family predicted Fe2+/Mn2+ transporter